MKEESDLADISDMSKLNESSAKENICSDLELGASFFSIYMLHTNHIKAPKCQDEERNQ